MSLVTSLYTPILTIRINAPEARLPREHLLDANVNALAQMRLGAAQHLDKILTLLSSLVLG
jgi:hypothetical protein